MASFIRVSWERSVVNLEKVSHIIFSSDKKKIYFVFDSMNDSEVNEVVWDFDCEVNFEKVKQYIYSDTPCLA